ncbi:MAG: enoyl-CoA hydratase [Peptococcaceae bacterium]|jgi:enoyl-CoA hydratase/carnithine racemase|nr:enoyl-CoA hydratase [Peptococcaceae bacterium]
MFQYIKVEIEQGLGWIVLNRPEVFNAFNDEMMEEISQVLLQWEKDPDIKVVAFRGEGKAFASGRDIQSLQAMTIHDAYNPLMQKLYQQVYTFPKVTFAAVNGYALGGGLELAVSCDIRIATPRAKFALPECKLGVIPGAGGTQRLVRIIGEARVKELIFLGDMLKAEEAFQVGLVKEVVPEENLRERVKQLAQKVMEKAPISIQAAKMLVNHSHDVHLGMGLLLENITSSYVFATKDKEEGVQAFLEKRSPLFQGK